MPRNRNRERYRDRYRDRDRGGDRDRDRGEEPVRIIEREWTVVEYEKHTNTSYRQQK